MWFIKHAEKWFVHICQTFDFNTNSCTTLISFPMSLFVLCFKSGIVWLRARPASRPVMVVTSSWVLRTRPSFGCRLPQHDFVFVFVCVFVFVFLFVFVFVFVYDFVTSSCCVPGQASGVVCHNMRDISNKMLSSPCHARIFTPLPLFESIFLSFCWHAMLLC